ncbi:uncharacterized protein MELLADRAFT_105630 [Melampsora larici-populina 98AG31]|uniref:Oligopeptide transporter n=1 Tax=Melampsora larici-populina (strain 98AG31 / pathotype 3-4-7) TaxID=747676 RepID=F4RIU9_MELLP|nr:uncharacterized protein MELLADRAFT_105630 [Melampsora larici-populina 98AG31]EGG07769.1 hypothetical protein MELLADRAFT_105630 [Melampsora larici-populina 98AG31]
MAEISAPTLPKVQESEQTELCTEKLPVHSSLDEKHVSDDEALVDDPEVYTVTFRACLVGVTVAVFAASVAQLVCFIFGSLLSKIPGPSWFNPGPFSSKELAFASIMAISAGIDAIAVQMLVAQDLYFNRRVPAILALATMMSSQLIGYGWAGLLRPLLIYPKKAVYPEMLPSVALLRSLAGRSELCKIQVRYFKKVVLAISLYEIFPSYIAPALQAVSPWCLALPRSPIVTQLFGGSRINEGMGLFAFTFDWTTLGGFGPLYTPLVAQINQWVAVLCSIFVFMAAYRYNWFGGGVSQGFPFIAYGLLDSHGNPYNVTAAIWPNGTENVDAVRLMGTPRMATTAIIGKSFTCMGASAAFTGLFLYHWKDLKSVIFRRGQGGSQEDPHRTITKNYRQFPAYVSAGFVLAGSGIWLSIMQLKLGQYLLLAPMSAVLAQLFGSILGTFVNYAVAWSLLKNEREVLLSTNGNGVFSGVHFLGFQSQAVSLMSQYTAAGEYSRKDYICRESNIWKPRVGFNYINIPIMANGFSALTGSEHPSITKANTSTGRLSQIVSSSDLSSGQMTAVAVGLWSQFYMKRYHRGWFGRYNDILNAALMGGTQITVLLLVLFFQGGIGWKVPFPQ